MNWRKLLSNASNDNVKLDVKASYIGLRCLKQASFQKFWRFKDSMTFHASFRDMRRWYCGEQRYG